MTQEGISFLGEFEHFWGILENRRNWKNFGIFPYVDVSMTWGGGGHMSNKMVAGEVYFHGGRYTKAGSYKLTKCWDL
jgi:hypothetical protein